MKRVKYIEQYSNDVNNNKFVFWFYQKPVGFRDTICVWIIKWKI